MKNYAIIRFYSDGRNSRIQKSGLDLKDAQAHCNDPETSSRTSEKGRNGCTCEWFDGWSEA